MADNAVDPIREYLQANGGTTDASVSHLLTTFGGSGDATSLAHIAGELERGGVFVEGGLDGLGPDDTVRLSLVKPQAASAGPEAPVNRAYCSECGAPHDADARFCKACGTSLMDESSAAPAGGQVDSTRKPVTLARRLKSKPVLIAAAVAALLLVAGGTLAAVLLSGDDTPKTERAASDLPTETETEPEDVPEDSFDAPEDDADSEPDVDQTTVGIGEGSEDDDLGIKVQSFEQVQSIPLDEYSDGPVTPAPGAKLYKAVIEFKNNGQTDADPLCGGGSVVLLDEDERNFEPQEDYTDIPGNEICGEGIAPGFKGTQTVGFEMPEDATPAGLVIWNGESDDDSTGEISNVLVPVS